MEKAFVAKLRTKDSRYDFCSKGSGESESLFGIFHFAPSAAITAVIQEKFPDAKINTILLEDQVVKWYWKVKYPCDFYGEYTALYSLELQELTIYN